MDVKCSNCGRGEDEEKLLKLRHKGREEYVCVHCLPYLIHG